MTETKPIRIVVQPIHAELRAAKGTPLRDLLFEQGVEFPCGGRGLCRGCRVRVLKGSAEANRVEQDRLSEQEIAGGWRLACQCAVEDDLEIELRQWDATILEDDTPFTFQPREGLGVAVDLGTTTLVAQLLDLQTGRVLAVRSALNAQARHGADVMSRLEFAVHGRGRDQLQALIREQTGALIGQLLIAAGLRNAVIKDVVIVGNTVMHHLFCGIDPEPLSHYPFEPQQAGLAVIPSRELGWKLAGEPAVRYLPCLGGFVGSDVLAGILATKLGESEDFLCLVDLGTNGEIVVGNKDGIVCASTAAGPAFEGARISMGMRASSGAISEVAIHEGQLQCRVLGNAAPQGICGSGLVDAVAAGLELGVIHASGRFAAGTGSWMILPPVALTQNDVRELQLAKAAIAAGIQLLRKARNAPHLGKVYLAGAFGNYINRASAGRIGLIDFPPEKVEAAGNTALLGAKIALFTPGGGDSSYAALRKRIKHVPLSSDPDFQDTFVAGLAFS